MTTGYKRLLLLIVFLSVVLILVGSYVRLSHAGLGCPDWPGCYGHLWMPQTSSDIVHAEKQYGASFFSDLAAKEMIHRYIVSFLALCIVVLFVMTWITRSPLLRRERKWTTALFCLVVVQAAFGMWTVTLRLRPIVVTTHLFGGLATFALALWMFFRSCSFRRPACWPPLSVRLGALVSLCAVIVQIILGGWVSTNYAGLSCGSVLLCQGKWIPALDFSVAFGGVSHAPFLILPPVGQVTVLWTHRLMAMFVFFIVSFFVMQLLRMRHRKTGVLLFVFLLLQVCLGISNIFFGLPKMIAVAHTVGAAFLLAALLWSNYLIFCVPYYASEF